MVTNLVNVKDYTDEELADLTANFPNLNEEELLNKLNFEKKNPELFATKIASRLSYFLQEEHDKNNYIEYLNHLSYSDYWKKELFNINRKLSEIKDCLNKYLTNNDYR